VHRWERRNVLLVFPSRAESKHRESAETALYNPLKDPSSSATVSPGSPAPGNKRDDCLFEPARLALLALIALLAAFSGRNCPRLSKMPIGFSEGEAPGWGRSFGHRPRSENSSKASAPVRLCPPLRAGPGLAPTKPANAAQLDDPAYKLADPTSWVPFASGLYVLAR